jgi:hypothetical protein
LALALAAAVVGPRYLGESSADDGRRNGVAAKNAPQIDIKRDGPLLAGTQLPLDVAISTVPYPLPIPPSNDETGPRVGIWLDQQMQTAFVWDTELRFYVEKAEYSEEEAAARWTRMTAAEPTVYQLGTVRGHVGLLRDLGAGEDPAVDSEPSSSLVFMENGLVMTFVSPVHQASELQSFAEQIRYP